jgi:hypothetical protein
MEIWPWSNSSLNLHLSEASGPHNARNTLRHLPPLRFFDGREPVHK